MDLANFHGGRRAAGARLAMMMLVAVSTLLLAPALLAQETTTGTTSEAGAESQATTDTNPVGVTSTWDSNVAPNAPGQEMTLDDQANALITKVNAYFNGMDNLQGEFLQTDAEAKQQKGKFFIKRPGRFRFVYAPPSKLIIVSDGELLSFEDHDLKHADRYPLDSTPLRILFAETVDILRDARVVDLYEDQDLATVTIQDKSEDNTGQIKLLFAKAGADIELREWVITSPEGGDTRIEIASLDWDKTIEDKLFRYTPLELEAQKKKQ